MHVILLTHLTHDPLTHCLLCVQVRVASWLTIALCELLYVVIATKFCVKLCVKNSGNYRWH